MDNNNNNNSQNISENTQIYLLKEKIKSLLSEETLSIGLILYILKDLTNQLQSAYDQFVYTELQQLQNSSSTQKQNQQTEEQVIYDSSKTITSIEPLQD